jgi:soluble lytic murein transglycosylase-like protein
MTTRVAVIRTGNAFHTFVYVAIIATLVAFSTMIDVQYMPVPTRGISTPLRPMPAQIFHRLIQLPKFEFWPAAREASELSAASEESAMSPKALMDRWQPLISEASKRFAVPENWIRAVMRIESGGRTILFGRPITSGAGAMGLMQLMGDTYNEMRARNSLGADPYNARDNIMAGAAYLHELYTKYGYPRLFAAYNAGPGRLEEHLHSGHALPAETRTYVRLATDGAVSTSFGEEKPIAKKSAKTRVAAVYQPAS